MRELRRDGTRIVRVGHKGAAALAPENTLASLAAALELGVDMVEFDVVLDHAGRLRLAHSLPELAADAPGLDEALAFLAAEAPAHVLLDVDLKDEGFEGAVLERLARHGLLARSLVCSTEAASLRELRRLAPAVRTGLSYPVDRRGVSGRPWLAPAVRAGTAGLAAALPYRVCALVEAAQATAAMLYHRVVTPAVVRRCRDRGIPVYAWTVDDPAELARVVAAGVDGVVSNDPRIFASLP